MKQKIKLKVNRNDLESLVAVLKHKAMELGQSVDSYDRLVALNLYHLHQRVGARIWVPYTQPTSFTFSAVDAIALQLGVGITIPTTDYNIILTNRIVSELHQALV